MFPPAARTADPGEAGAGIAAVEVLIDHLFDDRTEKAVFPFKTLFIFRQEALKMMKKHPVKNSLLWMTRTVEPGHIGTEESRNAPGTGSAEVSSDSVKKSPGIRPHSIENRQRSLAGLLAGLDRTSA